MKNGNNADINWVSRVGANRIGTIFFHRLIEMFGLRAAYLMLHFAAWQHVLLDKKSVSAIRDFRTRCGVPAGRYCIYRHFHSFGMSLIDRFYLTRTTGEGKFGFTYINEETIGREVQRGGGVILLGAHFGNWEIAGALLGKRLSKPVHVLMYDDRSEDPAGAAAGSEGIIIHPVQADAADTAVEIINALRAGEIVCLHGDRYFTGQRKTAIDFLGSPASFPAGPMAMAMITGASVIPCFTVRTSLFHYEFSAADPIRPEAADRNLRDKAIRTAMEKYVRVLETQCRKYPDQWYNFYGYWMDRECFPEENG